MSITLPSDADPFLTALITSLGADSRVVGLVLAGSSAERSRRDRWSDHDFLVVAEDGAPESMRTDLTWLPEPAEIAFSFRDTPHGLKALYRDGLLIEFAIFDRAEFDACALNHYEVVIDRGGIADAALAIKRRSMPASGVDRVLMYRSFLALVYIGTGRARRGERLSANVFLRDFATSHLLRLALDVAAEQGRSTAADALDPWRRFEHVWPHLGAALDEALARPITEVGPALLDATEPWLAEQWGSVPLEDLVTVRDLLSAQEDRNGY